MTMVEVGDLTPIKTGDVQNKEILKKLLFYIIAKRQKSTKTELVKLSFLIDYEYAQKIKQNISYSTVTYVRYNYGPYADAFTEALEELEREGKIRNDFDNPEVHKYEYVLTTEKVKNESEDILKDDIIRAIVQKVLSENKEKNLTEIKGIVYSLYEVKNTPFLGEIVLFKEGDQNNRKGTPLEIGK